MIVLVEMILLVKSASHCVMSTLPMVKLCVATCSRVKAMQYVCIVTELFGHLAQLKLSAVRCIW